MLWLMNTVIAKAIALAGGQKKLASACGVSQAAVSKWHLGGTVSAENALKIEAATGISRSRLRPDLWGTDSAHAAA